MAYIPNGNTYDEAIKAGYGWCLSIGSAADGDSHDLEDDEQNLYWCDNYAPANHQCNCLSLYCEYVAWNSANYYIYYNYGGKRYNLQIDGHMGDGNEIQRKERNAKADPKYDGDTILTLYNDFYGGRFCGTGNGGNMCCLEWDDDVEDYKDLQDNTNKGGREAKFDCDGGRDRFEWV